jgi:hypothetical protein
VFLTSHFMSTVTGMLSASSAHLFRDTCLNKRQLYLLFSKELLVSLTSHSAGKSVKTSLLPIGSPARIWKGEQQINA